MPRIAIIHIPDHTTDADTVDSIMLGMPPQYRLVGLYDFPNRSELKCNGSCVRGKTGAWGRDPRGFMRCSICGSRNKRTRQWFTRGLFDWFGANLMKREDTVALFRTPEGYGDNPVAQ